MPSAVAANIPPATPVPMALRLAEPAPVLSDQRHHAEDKRERGHQNGPQPQMDGFERGFDQTLALRACRSLAYSMIRIAFLVARPTVVRRPTLK